MVRFNKKLKWPDKVFDLLKQEYFYPSSFIGYSIKGYGYRYTYKSIFTIIKNRGSIYNYNFHLDYSYTYHDTLLYKKRIYINKNDT